MRLYLSVQKYSIINLEVNGMFRIQKGAGNANVPRTIRFTPALYEQLNQIAAQNDISFNLLVLQCCTYALANLETEERTDNGKR